MNAYWWLPILFAGLVLLLIGGWAWWYERERQRKGDDD
jgi:hypothetical protein